MAYKFFDKRFLVTPEDKDIIGRRVFYNDSLYALIGEVESGSFSRTDVLNGIADDSCCFDIDGHSWGLAYYDPNYKCKVAYSQGKQIQYSEGNDEWADCEVEPSWDECAVYRVKPDKWFVHEMAGGRFYKDNSSDTYVEFEGTEVECDAWIEEQMFKRRMTNKELARWLAEEKGQIFKNRMVSVSYYYLEGSDNAPVPGNVKIRAWSESEWHEPLVEVKA